MVQKNQMFGPVGFMLKTKLVQNWSFSSRRWTLHLHQQSAANSEMQLLTGVKKPATAATVAAAILLIASMPLTWSKEQLSSRECEDLGFTGLALCSDCHTLAEYIKDQELVSDCLKCCTEDSDDATSKITYSGAVVEVCMRKLVFYPEIVGFIEDEKDKFPSVKVQYIFNSPPKLILLDDEGQHKESIRIDNWKREHILQFLQEKVKRSSAI